MKKGLIIIALFFSYFTTQAGGWPQEKGHYYLKLGQWWVIADEHFIDDGKKDPNVTTGLFNTSLYGEYGFTDRLTGVLYFPFFSRAYYNNTVSGTTGEVITPGEAVNSIGDTDIGLKYGFLRKGALAMSATLTLGIPLGEDQGGVVGILQTGDGEFNQMLQIDAGLSFPVGKTYGYANAYSAYNNRTQGFSDEWRFGFEVGVNWLNNRLLTTLRAYGIESMQNGTLGEAITSTTIFANNSEHFTIAPEVAFRIQENWGVSVGYAKALSGKLIFSDPAYNVGVFLQF